MKITLNDLFNLVNEDTQIAIREFDNSFLFNGQVRERYNSPALLNNRYRQVIGLSMEQDPIAHLSVLKIVVAD